MNTIFGISLQLINIGLLFGIPLGIIICITAFFFGKKINKETGFRTLALCMGIWGFILSLVGVSIEVNAQEQIGLILIVLGGVFMSCSGIFASITIKFEEERKSKEMEKRLKEAIVESRV